MGSSRRRRRRRRRLPLPPAVAPEGGDDGVVEERPVHLADLAAVVGGARAGHRGRHGLPVRGRDDLLRRETETIMTKR